MKQQRITFGRMYPNAGYVARYRRELKRLIKAMDEDTKREIRALYSDVAQDAKKPKTLVSDERLSTENKICLIFRMEIDRIKRKYSIG